jgi:hypothetical protein
MKSGTLLLWLALFGSDPNVPPSALTANVTAPAPVAESWVGEWLVYGERRVIAAVLGTVRGREQLAGKLTFGDGHSSIVEHWIGRREGRWLRLTRSGVGDGRVFLTEDGRLVGRLNRFETTGDVQLSRP